MAKTRAKSNRVRVVSSVTGKPYKQPKKIVKEDFTINKEAIIEVVETTAERFYIKLPAMVNNIMESAIYSFLGVTKSFGEPHIESSGLLYTVMKAKVDALIKAETDSWLDKLINKLKNDEGLLERFASVVRDRYRYELEQKLLVLVRDAAASEGEGIFEKIISQIKSSMEYGSVHELELENPKTPKGKLGEAMLVALYSAVTSNPAMLQDVINDS